MKNALVFLCLSALFFNIEAKHKNCDTLGVNFYRAIGCKSSGTYEGCPSYEKCVYSQPIGSCVYQGHHMDKGQNTNDVVKDSSCNFGCICSPADNEKGSFVCAQGQCGEYPPIEGKSNCIMRYSLDKCCPSGPECLDEAPATCKVGSQSFKEGERFTPEGTCITCVCTKDFDGKLDGPNCMPSSCGIEVRNAADIENNCAPLYFANKTDAICCPITLVCPSANDVIKESNDNSGKVCRYGEKTLKLGSTIETTNDEYGQRKVECACELPPLMTCRMTYH